MRRFALLGVALAAIGCAVPLRADGRWTELRSDHFRVLTDVDPALAAREVPRVETVLAGIAARLRPDRPLPPRLDVLWIRATDGVDALGVAHARGYYLPHQGDEPSTPPLVVVSGAPGRDVEQALVHELAHVLFVDAAPTAPPWLAEGMAAYFDTLDIDNRALSFDDPNNVHLFRVDALLRAKYSSFHQSLLSGWVYSSARGLVALLESDAELAPRLAAYIRRLGDGDAAERAWDESFAGISVDELQGRFNRFYLRGRTALQLAAWHGDVAARSEMPPAVERWLARARPWDSPRALDEAGRALARAAADDSAERHYWSGVYASAQKRWSDAVAELRRALARDPTMAAAALALSRVQARLRAAR